jgi:hypothetical protein
MPTNKKKGTKQTKQKQTKQTKQTKQNRNGGMMMIGTPGNTIIKYAIKHGTKLGTEIVKNQEAMKHVTGILDKGIDRFAYHEYMKLLLKHHNPPNASQLLHGNNRMHPMYRHDQRQNSMYHDPRH